MLLATLRAAVQPRRALRGQPAAPGASQALRFPVRRAPMGGARARVLQGLDPSPKLLGGAGRAAGAPPGRDGADSPSPLPLRRRLAAWPAGCGGLAAAAAAGGAVILLD